MNKKTGVQTEIEVEKVKGMEMVVKKQKVSKSYTLKAVKGNIDKIKEMKLITEEERKIMDEIRKKAIERWMDGEEV